MLHKAFNVYNEVGKDKQNVDFCANFIFRKNMLNCKKY